MSRSILFTVALSFGLAPLAGAHVDSMPDKVARELRSKPARIVVLDGSNVHNVGELQIHVGNWGLFGSLPGAGFPFSETPSAQWPAGSGVEYLYGSGLWVGAVKEGVPAVSTSLFATEFRPTPDPIDIIYRSYENAENGRRLPHADADDDGDGDVDEDWLNGRDDDGDGAIDEDFAAISNQMFSCWYTDDQEASGVFPEHNPLHIKVRQESYQWHDDSFDDFVGIAYTITNIGTSVLEEVYLGYFMDPDCGNRNEPGYNEDDASGFLSLAAICTESGGSPLDIAYAYDLDGDGGRTPGYFGVAVLGHTTDEYGETAPEEVGVSTFAIFSGQQSFEDGGDPTNDFERYEILSSRTIERDQLLPRDHRVLIGIGPFDALSPGQSLHLQLALVAGEGRAGMVENASRAKLAFNGAWFNVDGSKFTGVDRRETPIVGPAENVVIDACRPEYSQPIPVVPAGYTLWINRDCEEEERIKLLCGYDEADSLIFRTGVDGRETQVHWIVPSGGAKEVTLDILPGSCRNPFNLGWADNPGRGGDKPGRGGVLPVALAGSGEFDVQDVDLATVALEGIAPLRSSFGDVTSVPESDGACPCPGGGPDGYLDLMMKFSRGELVGALLAKAGGDVVPVTVSGTLLDGTPFEGTDCVLRLNGGANEPPGPGEQDSERPRRPTIGQPSPNPFNPTTRIAYTLPISAHVRLYVYNVTGQVVARLVDGSQEAGEYSITWDARSLPSGVYFYYFESGEVKETRKIMLIK